MLHTRELTKRYGSTVALSECSLDVARGEVFGLLGPNGAGKTTLVRLLLGFLTPTSGSATIDGFDCRRQSTLARRRTAYLPAEARLYRRMSGHEALEFLTSVRDDGDLARARQLAERLDLDPRRRVAAMSTGMRQKLAIAAVWANRAPLIILDEPTANLDPTVRGVVLEMVREARAEGRAVLFSSHVISEMEEVCDRVAVIRGGRVVRLQEVKQLRSQYLIRARVTGQPPRPPGAIAGQVSVYHDGDDLMIQTTAPLHELLAWLATLPIALLHVEPVGLRAIYDDSADEAGP